MNQRRSNTRSVAISRLFGALLLFFTAVIVSRRVNLGRPITLYHLLMTDPAIMLFFGIYFIGLSLIGDTPRARIAQIVGLILYGTLAVWFIVPIGYAGDLTFILAAALAYRYGFLVRRRLLVIGVMMTPLVAARFLLISRHLEITTSQAVNHLAITTAMIAFLYWIFEERLERSQAERDHLADVQRANSPFVEFGRNVAGIVHDFRNDLSLFESFGQILDVTVDEPIGRERIRQYRQYVGRLRDRIERILYVTRVSARREAGDIDLDELIRSTLYVFQANLEFKRQIHFAYHPGETLFRVHAPPAGLVAILENLIRNSCEALVDFYVDNEDPISPARLTIGVHRSGSNVLIVVTDNGPGIPGCPDDPQDNCLSADHPVVGWSSKERGNGLGLLSVVRNAHAIGAEVRLTSPPGAGVTATVELPGSIVEPSDGPA